MVMEHNMNTVCERQFAPITHRVNQSSEIPQTETMIPISELKDDKGQEISSTWKNALTDSILAVHIELEDGNQLLLQPMKQSGKEELVPSNAHFVRDELTQEPIWRLPSVSAG